MPKKPTSRFMHSLSAPQDMDSLERFAAVFDGSRYSTIEKLIQFPLFVRRQDVANFLIKYEIFKRILRIHGSIVECGVFFGRGLLSWAQFSAILEPVNYNRRIIGFDTFEGMPAPAAEDESSLRLQGAVEKFKVKNAYEEIGRCIELFDSNRFLNHIPKIELVRGDARKTIPKYVEENPHLLVSLLYLDFDLYEPTRVALSTFLPRMPKGAIVAFDEANEKTWPGETMAALESQVLSRGRLERLEFGSLISFVQLD